ncbi:hypothetical protein [Flavobacterium sp. AG291]|uniref:hypothetical protein n=1 Tax=Flavobacterium sp. AG291 TaxID=2184000 RepID=UPI000E0CA82A|nr:hypothetical protein [Flavobacterium sp. AG291]RDI06717.1 hypothetical protein DEU42_11462 [Flavobacterium sp. AG291]
MEVYFVILRLPDNCGHKFIDGVSPHHFWEKTSRALNEKQAQIVSVRTDTGGAEELRDYVTNKEFSSYFVFYLMMEKQDIKNHELILQKADDIIKVGNSELLIDADDNFQLVTIDYNDISDFPQNLGSGNPQLSA